MALKPARRNFSVWKGATWRKVLTLYTGDTVASDKRDLTGCTAAFSVRDPSTSAVLESLTTENGGIELGGNDGTITLYISDEDTAAATWTQGIYQLFIIEPNGDANVYLHGTISLVGVG